jgi:uncharacterized NAD-dependent epimerase/dehydratase family protein
MLPKATVLARGFFKNKHGKTAHGLIRYGTRYHITSVVDESCSGEDAAEFLRLTDQTIPIVSEVPDDSQVLIIGVAPSGGLLPSKWRSDIKTAIENGMDIVSGLHQFLGDDPEFSKLAREHGVAIWDVRRPPKELRVATGYRSSVPVVLTLGTDACVGKRTTALELVRAANSAGYKPGFVATGQTGIMIGCDSGVVADSLPADFISGMVEKCIKESETEIRDRIEGCEGRAEPRTPNPEPRGNVRDVIFVEGQGSLGHFAYGTSTHGILYGSQPSGIVLVHAPGRDHKSSFPGSNMPAIEDELRLINAHMDVPLLGIALNFFELDNKEERENRIVETGQQFGVPVEDVLSSGAGRIFGNIRKNLLVD